MHPRPIENETHTLAPDLNRGMTAGMDRVDVNAHLDDTGISHGTKQGLMRAHGIDRGTSQARMETPRESDKLTLEQSAQGIDKIINQDSKLTELQLNPHKNKKHHQHFNSADGDDDERVLQRKEEDRKWGKKEKPDSA